MSGVKKSLGTILQVVGLVVGGPIGALIALGGSYVSAKQQQRDLERARNQQREDTGTLANLPGSANYIPYAIGDQRIGCVLSDVFVTNGSWEVVDEGEYAWTVYVLGIGPHERLDQMYYYDNELLSGNLNAGTLYDFGSGQTVEKFRDFIAYQWMDGSAGQGVSSLLNRVTEGGTNRYGSNRVAPGVSYLVFVNKRDQQNNLISEPSPRGMTFDGRWRKVRDFTQDGQPLVWTKNPALHLVEMTRDDKFGPGRPDTYFKWSDMRNFYDYCEDEGFQMSGVFGAGATLGEMYQDIAIHSDSIITIEEGQLAVKLNQLLVSADTRLEVNDTNVVGAITRYEASTTNIPNTLTSSYIGHDGIEQNVVHQNSDAVIAAEGFRPRQAQFRLADSESVVNKLAARSLVEARLPTYNIELSQEFYFVSIGDIISLNIDNDIVPTGTRMKVLNVEKRRILEPDQAPVIISGVVYSDDVFTDAVDNIVVLPQLLSDAPGPNNVQTPNVTSVDTVNNDNTVSFEFDNGRPDLSLEWQVSNDGGNNWESHSGPRAAVSPAFVNLPNDGRATWRLRFRFVNTAGVKGGWYSTANLDNRDQISILVNQSNQFVKIFGGAEQSVVVAGFDSDDALSIIESVIDSDYIDTRTPPQPGFYSAEIPDGLTDSTITDVQLTTAFRDEFSFGVTFNVVPNTIVNFFNDSDSFYRKWTGSSWTSYALQIKGDAVIDGTLDVVNAQIGDSIQSLNYDPDDTNPSTQPPDAGWRLTKDGNLYLAGGAFIGRISSDSIDYAEAEQIFTSSNSTGGSVSNTTDDVIFREEVSDLPIDSDQLLTVELTNFTATTRFVKNTTFLSNYWTTAGNGDNTPSNYRDDAPILGVFPSSGSVTLNDDDIVFTQLTTTGDMYQLFRVSVFDGGGSITITGTAGEQIFETTGALGNFSVNGTPSRANGISTWGAANVLTFPYSISGFDFGTALEIRDETNGQLVHRTQAGTTDALYDNNARADFLFNSTGNLESSLTINTDVDTSVLNSGDDIILRQMASPSLTGTVLEDIGITMISTPNANGSPAQLRIRPIQGDVDAESNFTLI